MSFENIKLKYSNFAIRGGYFFTFVHDNDILFKKNTEGDVVFTYPLDTSLEDSEIIDMCCDGINFWTLQEGTSANYRVIKKWRLESHLCKLIDTLSFGNVSNYYESESFSIESFCSILAEELPIGSTYITLPESFTTNIPVGTVITIGPNVDGFHEEVTVTGTISSNVYGLDFYTSMPHVAGEDVSFVNNFWMFNNYKGIIEDPSLMRYNLVNSEWDYTVEDDSFDSTTGSVFYIDTDNNNYYILYVYGTVLRFFNIDTKEIDKSFTMDNIRTDGTTIIPIYGLDIEGDTVYRLQNYMKYFETNYSQATYNYQCSTLRSFVDSISMELYPKILPSNGISLAEVTTIIQDQYGNPSQYKAAHLSDDDTTGYLTIEKPLTNLQGVATSYYRAGLSVREVTVTSLATQYD
jgi:hypothetical protein